jgi:hypothetical protein
MYAYLVSTKGGQICVSALVRTKVILRSALPPQHHHIDCGWLSTEVCRVDLTLPQTSAMLVTVRDA